MTTEISVINRTVHPAYAAIVRVTEVKSIDELHPGMPVVYVPMEGMPEFGRVSSLRDDGKAAFVRYHMGDTAAATLLEDLRRVVVVTS